MPDPEAQLPAGPLPGAIGYEPYPADAKPVFFGQYWPTGEIVLQAPNALCLDYSAGKEGPLVAYTVEDGSTGLDLRNVTVGVMQYVDATLVAPKTLCNLLDCPTLAQLR